MLFHRFFRSFAAPGVGFALLLLPGVATRGAQLVVGSGPGSTAVVKRFPDSATSAFEALSPFPAEFQGGAKVAADAGVIVAGAGAGGGSHVKVYDANTLAETGSFFAFTPSFPGGVTVAAGDGRIAVGVGPGSGAGPQVKLFNATSLAEEGNFFAFDPAFTGGVDVALGDGQLVVGAGPGGGSQVKVFDATTLALAGNFFAFDPAFTGGVDVAIGGGRIAVGAGAGAAAHIKVYDAATLAEAGSFLAFDPAFTGGVRVAIGDGQLVVGTADGSSQIKVYDLATLTELHALLAFDAGYTAGVEVAVTASPPAVAPTGSTISAESRYAYAANFGWIDARPSGTDGVRLTDHVLSGWLYSANTGWIHVGDGTPANGVAYANDSATDYGVNVSLAGALSGHAWSPNLGWITFEPNYGKPTVVRSSGAFTGSAWSANAGWISLGGFPQALVSTSRAEGLDTDNDDLPDWWEIQRFTTIEFTTGDAILAGQTRTNREEYLDARGTFNFGGYVWSGAYPEAPTAMHMIQNWSPRIPPETFTGFTAADTLNVNSPGATLLGSLYGLTVNALNFNSAGGTLQLANWGLISDGGLNLNQGSLDLSAYVEIDAPIRTAAGTHTRIQPGQFVLRRTFENTGDFSLEGLAYIPRFTNRGHVQFDGAALQPSLRGHFIGEAGSQVSLNSTIAPVDDPTAAGFALWVGSLDWNAPGDFDIAERSHTIFSLNAPADGDSNLAYTTNRFVLGGGLEWTVDRDAHFWVQSGTLTVYANPEPQVLLRNLTLANAGTVLFQSDEIAVENVEVTGHPILVTGQNNRPPTRLRRLTQDANLTGTLALQAYSGAFTLEQPTLTHRIELTLGRDDASTTVAAADLVNAATLRIAGSTGYSTLLTPPATDTASTPARTLRNDGTLDFTAGRAEIAHAITNTGTMTVASGAEVRLPQPLANTGTLSIAEGGRVVSGPVGDLVPTLNVDWTHGTINNHGEFTLSKTVLTYAAVQQDPVIFNGNPVRLENSYLIMSYPLTDPTPTRFSFAGMSRATTPELVASLPSGTFWRIEPGSQLRVSSFYSGATLEFAGSANGIYPTAFLFPTGEWINSGLVRTVDAGGILQGLMINFGQVEITAGSTLMIATPPHEEGVVTLPGRLINNPSATTHIAEGGTLRVGFGTNPSNTYELNGGTLHNEGTFIADQGSKLRFFAGTVSGRPVEVAGASLEIGGTLTNGAFVFRTTANELTFTNGFLPASGSLRLENAYVTAPDAFTNRGTLVLTSAPDNEASSFLTVLGDGLTNDEGALLHIKNDVGPTRTRYLNFSYHGKGTLRIDAGAQVYGEGPGHTWNIGGLLEIGAGGWLAFAQGTTAFTIAPGGTLRGSGQLAPNTDALTVSGTLEPIGTLSLSSSVFFEGRLVAKLRASGADRIDAAGIVTSQNARIEFGADPGFTPAVGTRYVVATATAFNGPLPVVSLDPALAALYTATVDSDGTTLGVTLQPLAPPATSFASWASHYQLTNTAPNSDPDGDGIPLLVEYALDLNPTAASTTSLLQVSTTASDWVATYTRPADRPDLAYAVEFSLNLTSWTTSGVTHEFVSTTAGVQTWRARIPLSSAANAFFRLRIDRP